MCLQFGFVNFWQKDFGTKAAHKMLVKLTPGGRSWQLIYPQSFFCSIKDDHHYSKLGLPEDSVVFCA
jgi:hypothetical protein